MADHQQDLGRILETLGEMREGVRGLHRKTDDMRQEVREQGERLRGVEEQVAGVVNTVAAVKEGQGTISTRLDDLEEVSEEFRNLRTRAIGGLAALSTLGSIVVFLSPGRRWLEETTTRVLTLFGIS